MRLSITGYYTLKRGTTQLPLSRDNDENIIDEIRFRAVKDGSEDVAITVTQNTMLPGGNCAGTELSGDCGQFNYFIDGVPVNENIQIFMSVYVAQYDTEYDIASVGPQDVSPFQPINPYLEFNENQNFIPFSVALDLNIPDAAPVIQGLSFTEGTTDTDILANQLSGFQLDNVNYANFTTTPNDKLIVKFGQTICLNVNTTDDFGIQNINWSTSVFSLVTLDVQDGTACITFNTEIPVSGNINFEVTDDVNQTTSSDTVGSFPFQLKLNNPPSVGIRREDSGDDVTYENPSILRGSEIQLTAVPNSGDEYNVLTGGTESLYDTDYTYAWYIGTPVGTPIETQQSFNYSSNETGNETIYVVLNDLNDNHQQTTANTTISVFDNPPTFTLWRIMPTSTVDWIGPTGNIIDIPEPQAQYKAGRTLSITSQVTDDVGLQTNQPVLNWTTPSGNFNTDIFSDGNNSYTFLNSGNYQLSLSATDNNGQTTTTETLLISVLDNQPPQIQSVNINPNGASDTTLTNGGSFTFYKPNNVSDNIQSSFNFTISSADYEGDLISYLFEIDEDGALPGNNNFPQDGSVIETNQIDNIITDFLDSNGDGNWTRVITITPSDSVGSGDSFSFSINYLEAEPPTSRIKFRPDYSAPDYVRINTYEPYGEDGFIELTNFDPNGNRTLDLYDVSLVNGLEFQVFPETDGNYSYSYNFFSDTQQLGSTVTNQTASIDASTYFFGFNQLDEIVITITDNNTGGVFIRRIFLNIIPYQELNINIGELFYVEENSNPNGGYNVEIPVENFTMIENIDVEMEIVTQPSNGSIQVINPTAKKGENFQLSYIPNENWNSTPEVNNGQIIDDLFKYRVREKLFNPDAEQYTYLADAFNQTYNTSTNPFDFTFPLPMSDFAEQENAVRVTAVLTPPIIAPYSDFHINVDEAVEERNYTTNLNSIIQFPDFPNDTPDFTFQSISEGTISDDGKSVQISTPDGVDDITVQIQNNSTLKTTIPGYSGPIGPIDMNIRAFIQNDDTLSDGNESFQFQIQINDIALIPFFPNAFSDAVQQGVGLEGFEDFTISLADRLFFVGNTNNLSIITLETQTEEINVLSDVGSLDITISLTDTAKDFNGSFDLTLELQYQDGAETIFYEQTFEFIVANVLDEVKITELTTGTTVEQGFNNIIIPFQGTNIDGYNLIPRIQYSEDNLNAVIDIENSSAVISSSGINFSGIITLIENPNFQIQSQISPSIIELIIEYYDDEGNLLVANRVGTPDIPTTLITYVKSNSAPSITFHGEDGAEISSFSDITTPFYWEAGSNQVGYEEPYPGLIEIGDDYTLPQNLDINVQVNRLDTGENDLKILLINNQSEPVIDNTDSFPDGGGINVIIMTTDDETLRRKRINQLYFQRDASVSDNDPHFSKMTFTFTDDGQGETGFDFLESKSSSFDLYVQVGQWPGCTNADALNYDNTTILDCSGVENGTDTGCCIFADLNLIIDDEHKVPLNGEQSGVPNITNVEMTDTNYGTNDNEYAIFHGGNVDFELNITSDLSTLEQYDKYQLNYYPQWFDNITLDFNIPEVHEAFYHVLYPFGRLEKYLNQQVVIPTDFEESILNDWAETFESDPSFEDLTEAILRFNRTIIKDIIGGYFLNMYNVPQGTIFGEFYDNPDSRGMFSPAYSTYQNPNDSFLNDNTTERSWYFNSEQTNYKKSPFINDIIYYLKYGNISEDENPNDNPILRDSYIQIYEAGASYNEDETFLTPTKDKINFLYYSGLQSVRNCVPSMFFNQDGIENNFPQITDDVGNSEIFLPSHPYTDTWAYTHGYGANETINSWIITDYSGTELDEIPIIPAGDLFTCCGGTLAPIYTAQGGEGLVCNSESLPTNYIDSKLNTLNFNNNFIQDVDSIRYFDSKNLYQYLYELNLWLNQDLSSAITFTSEYANNDPTFLYVKNKIQQIIDDGKTPTVAEFAKLFGMNFDGFLVDYNQGNVLTPEVHVIKMKVTQNNDGDWEPLHPECFQNYDLLLTQTNMGSSDAACELIFTKGGVDLQDDTSYDSAVKLNVLPWIEETKKPIIYPSSEYFDFSESETIENPVIEDLFPFDITQTYTSTDEIGIDASYGHSEVYIYYNLFNLFTQTPGSPPLWPLCAGEEDGAQLLGDGEILLGQATANAYCSQLVYGEDWVNTNPTDVFAVSWELGPAPTECTDAGNCGECWNWCGGLGTFDENWCTQSTETFGGAVAFPTSGWTPYALDVENYPAPIPINYLTSNEYNSFDLSFAQQYFFQPSNGSEGLRPIINILCSNQDIVINNNWFGDEFYWTNFFQTTENENLLISGIESKVFFLDTIEEHGIKSNIVNEYYNYFMMASRVQSINNLSYNAVTPIPVNYYQQSGNPHIILTGFPTTYLQNLLFSYDTESMLAYLGGYYYNFSDFEIEPYRYTIDGSEEINNTITADLSWGDEQVETITNSDSTIDVSNLFVDMSKNKLSNDRPTFNHTYSEGGVYNSQLDMNFKLDSLYTNSEILYTYTQNFDSDIIENEGPDGNFYYIINETFGNNPNKVRVYIRGEGDFIQENELVDNGENVLWRWDSAQNYFEQYIGLNQLSTQLEDILQITDYQVIFGDNTSNDTDSNKNVKVYNAGNVSEMFVTGDGSEHIYTRAGNYTITVRGKNIFSPITFTETADDNGNFWTWEGTGDAPTFIDFKNETDFGVTEKSLDISIVSIVDIQQTIGKSYPYTFFDPYAGIRFETNREDNPNIELTCTISENSLDNGDVASTNNDLAPTVIDIYELSKNMNNFEWCQADRRPSLGVFTPHKDLTTDLSQDVTLNCLGDGESCNVGGLDYSHHQILINERFDDGYNFCANLDENDCANYENVGCRIEEDDGDFVRCVTYLLHPGSGDEEYDVSTSTGAVYVMPAFDIRSDSDGDGSAIWPDGTVNLKGTYFTGDGIGYIADEGLYLEFPSFYGKNYLFTVDADIRPNISIGNFEVAGSSMVYWDPIMDRENYNLNSVPVEVRMFLYPRAKTTVNFANWSNPNTGYHSDTILFNQYSNLFGNVIDANLGESAVPESNTEEVHVPYYNGISNLFQDRPYIENSTKIGELLPKPKHFANTDEVLGIPNQDIIGYYGEFSGLYVCDLQWGDEEEGDILENPCENFWTDNNKDNYKKYKLLNSKFLNHTYRKSGVFSIKGVVFSFVDKIYSDETLTEQDAMEVNTIVASREFVARINVNPGSTNSDFEFLGGDNENATIPYGEPFNNQIPNPVIGGFSENSLYYKYMSAYLGYFVGSSEYVESDNPSKLQTWDNIGDNIRILEQASQINGDLRFELPEGSPINSLSGEDMPANLNNYTGSLITETHDSPGTPAGDTLESIVDINENNLGDTDNYMDSAYFDFRGENTNVPCVGTYTWRTMEDCDTLAGFSCRSGCDTIITDATPEGFICIPTQSDCRERFLTSGECPTFANGLAASGDTYSSQCSETSTFYADFQFNFINGNARRAKSAVVVNNGRFKNRGELGEYTGEMDIQSVKFNTGVEPLVSHLIGDKNCAIDKNQLVGKIDESECGFNCSVLCYNASNREYTQEKTELECTTSGGAVVTCLFKKDDGCYEPVFTDFQYCCELGQATNNGETIWIGNDFLSDISYGCPPQCLVDEVNQDGTNPYCQSSSELNVYCTESVAMEGEGVGICSQCREEQDGTIWSEDNPNDCTETRPYCLKNPCTLDNLCQSDQFSCNECPEITNGLSNICHEKALLENPNCVLDEYNCPEDLTCRTECGCGGNSSSGLTCNPPRVGCTDPYAINYNSTATCNAPIGTFNECWYFGCSEEKLVNCNENLSCECHVEFLNSGVNSWGTYGGNRAEDLTYNDVNCGITMDEAGFTNCYNLPIIPFNSGYNLDEILQNGYTSANFGSRTGEFDSVNSHIYENWVVSPSTSSWESLLYPEDILGIEFPTREPDCTGTCGIITGENYDDPQIEYNKCARGHICCPVMHILKNSTYNSNDLVLDEISSESPQHFIEEYGWPMCSSQCIPENAFGGNCPTLEQWVATYSNHIPLQKKSVFDEPKPKYTSSYTINLPFGDGRRYVDFGTLPDFSISNFWTPTQDLLQSCGMDSGTSNWNDKLREDSSNYDGSCPTRWWCPIEDFGRLWDDFEDDSENNYNYFYLGFYEKDECDGAVYPGHGNPYDNVEITCPVPCKNEVELFLDDSGVAIERFGKSGPLPRRVCGDGCPCFCDNGYGPKGKDGGFSYGNNTGPILDNVGEEADSFYQNWPLPQDGEYSSIWNTETGGLANWVYSLLVMCRDYPNIHPDCNLASFPNIPKGYTNEHIAEIGLPCGGNGTFLPNCDTCALTLPTTMLPAFGGVYDFTENQPISDGSDGNVVNPVYTSPEDLGFPPDSSCLNIRNGEQYGHCFNQLEFYLSTGLGAGCYSYYSWHYYYPEYGWITQEEFPGFEREIVVINPYNLTENDISQCLADEDECSNQLSNDVYPDNYEVQELCECEMETYSISIGALGQVYTYTQPTNTDNPDCTPPPIPNEVTFGSDCAGPTACLSPVKCQKYKSVMNSIATFGEGGESNNRNGNGESGGSTGGDYFRDDMNSFNDIVLTESTPILLSQEIGHYDNPGSPMYWQNIIPENYDVTNRIGVINDGENIIVSQNTTLETSTQEYTGTHNLLNNQYPYYYPVLPKLNKNAKTDVELGLQTILIKPDEDSDLICPVAKTPFVSRSTFIDVLNSQQCLSSNPLSSTLAIDVGFDYSWNNYDGCDVSTDSSLYDGLINLDFSELIENQALNCINSDCIGFIVGDYRINLRFNNDDKVVLKETKLTQPLLPKLINNIDGAI